MDEEHRLGITLYEIEDLLDRYSSGVYSRAKANFNKGGVIRDTSTESLVFTVAGSRKGSTYRVFLYPGAGMTCTCVNGTHLGGYPLCFHSASVLYSLAVGLRGRSA